MSIGSIICKGRKYRGGRELCKKRLRRENVCAQECSGKKGGKTNHPGFVSV